MRYLFLSLVMPLLALQQVDKPYRVKIHSPMELSLLYENGADIGNSGSDWVKVYANETTYDMLVQLGYNPIELVDTSYMNMVETHSTLDWGAYHTYAEIVTELMSLELDYPEKVEYFVIGESVEGRDIPGIKLTSEVAVPADKPEFIMISTMHGDEPIGTEFMLAFAESLLTKYGTDPFITRIVDSVEIYLVPLLNPDGYIAGTRRNSNGRDLNRNFPVPDGSIGDDYSWSIELETQETMDFLAGRYPCFSHNFHGGALVVNYAWDYMSTLSDDDDLYIARALDYSTRNIPMYTGSFSQGITNGYAWYEADGSLQDWDYWQTGSIHLTVELYNTKWPAASLLDDIWEDNYEAFLFAPSRTLLGIRGIVTDSITHEPLDADIDIVGISMPLFCDPSIGDYHKMLLPGEYDISFSHAGYISKSFSVTIPDTGALRLDVELAPANYDTLYFSDFEDDDGGLLTTSFLYYMDWEYGTPGTVTPHSGIMCWGTKLMTDYHDSSQSRLGLDVDLSSVVDAELRFWHWHVFQPALSGAFHDGGNIKWSGSGGTDLLIPEGGYDHTISEYNLFIPEEQAFTESSGGWEEVVIDLSAYSGQSGTIFFDFGSSSVNTEDGWFIDDILIATATPLYVVEEGAELPEFININVHPNPFNSSCVIQSEHSFTIYDLEGRVIHSGNAGTTEWSPQTSSGIYLVKGNGIDIPAKRLVFLK